MKDDHIINKIKEARKRSKYTQDQMALRLNISSNSYKKIESGKTTLIRHRLWQIIEILNIDVLDLFIDNEGEQTVYSLKRELNEQQERYEENINKIKANYDYTIEELKAEINILKDTLKHKETIIGILKDQKGRY